MVWKNEDTLKQLQMLTQFLNTKMRHYIHQSIGIAWQTQGYLEHRDVQLITATDNCRVIK